MTRDIPHDMSLEVLDAVFEELQPRSHHSFTMRVLDHPEWIPHLHARYGWEPSMDLLFQDLQQVLAGGSLEVILGPIARVGPKLSWSAEQQAYVSYIYHSLAAYLELGWRASWSYHELMALLDILPVSCRNQTHTVEWMRLFHRTAPTIMDAHPDRRQYLLRLETKPTSKLLADMLRAVPKESFVDLLLDAVQLGFPVSQPIWAAIFGTNLPKLPAILQRIAQSKADCAHIPVAVVVEVFKEKFTGKWSGVLDTLYQNPRLMPADQVSKLHQHMLNLVPTHLPEHRALMELLKKHP